LDISEASTWQFYELDSVVTLGESDGKARRLSVTTNTPGRGQGDSLSHFGVSIFGESENPLAEEGVERLPALERQVQPMLDWLAVNHHDFIRLNDFSEAFSLLRWLKSKEVPVNIIDIAGRRPQIATPDQVGEILGPRVGRR